MYGVHGNAPLDVLGLRPWAGTASGEPGRAVAGESAGAGAGPWWLAPSRAGDIMGFRASRTAHRRGGLSVPATSASAGRLHRTGTAARARRARHVRLITLPDSDRAEAFALVGDLTQRWEAICWDDVNDRLEQGPDA
ncbi:hypothetical protein [Streptomyces sp. bgisy159]|uniref:hypothetical protein n=1 Tax=Streptomyces sp. bgisy159 TaxID=3413795 RepID=UPI003F4A2446